MRLRAISALLVGLLAGICHADCNATKTYTTTTNVGIPKPALNNCGWGTDTNKNWDIVDSSMAVKANANTFLSTNTFSQPVIINSTAPLRFQDLSTHYIEFRASQTVTTTSFILPSADGTSGQFLKTDGARNLSFGPSAGSGSTLAVNQNGVAITSPTPVLNGLSPPFLITSVGGGSTAQWTLDPSSVTEQGNTFNQANKLVQLDSSSRLPSVDGSLLTNIASVPGSTIYPASATASFPKGFTASTGTFSSDVNVTGIVGIRAGNRLKIYGSGDVAVSTITNPAASSSQLRIDAANGVSINTPPINGVDLILPVIQITSNTVLSGVTFYANGTQVFTTPITVLNGGSGTSSPSLIAGTNITSITGSWPNQTINAATQSGSGGNASGQINNGSTYQTPFYSVAGSSNVLSATSNIQVFPSSVTILGAIPIVSTSTLQAGATIYVSSENVVGPITVGNGTISPQLNIFVTANSHTSPSLQFVGDASVNGDALIDYDASPGGMYSRLQITNTNLNSGVTEKRYRTGWNFEDSNSKVLAYINKSGGLTLNATGQITLYDGPTANFVSLKSSNTMPSSLTLTLPSSDGLVNQCMATDGNAALSFKGIVLSTPTSQQTTQMNISSGTISTFYSGTGGITLHNSGGPGFGGDSTIANNGVFSADVDITGDSINLTGNGGGNLIVDSGIYLNSTTRTNIANAILATNGSSVIGSTIPNLGSNAFTGTLATSRFPALTGDITTSAGSVATTLASVVTANQFGSATVSPVITFDAKGRITAVSSATISGGSGGQPIYPSTGTPSFPFGMTTTSTTFTLQVQVSSNTILANTTFYQDGTVIIGNTNTTPAANDFRLQISSNNGTTALFQINNNGHVVSSGTVPAAPTSCGVSPSMDNNSTDFAGIINVGSGVVTSCTFNPISAFVNSPICVCSDDSSTVSCSVTSRSTTAEIFSLTATLGSGHIYYICVGAKG